MKSEHNYSGYLDLICQLYRREGWHGFYKGFGATCLKVIPATAVLFICNNKLKILMMEKDQARNQQIGDLVTHLPESKLNDSR